MGMSRLLLSLVFVSLIVSISANDYEMWKGFDDNILFSLEWPGADSNLEFLPDQEKVSIKVTSQAQEKYECYLPELAKSENLENPSTLETSVLDYLEPLFTGDVCSYRIETYWTYEICHGNYIKQYHEERDGKTSKLQEYYLGKWNTGMTAELRKKLEANKNEKLKYKKIDGLNLPYFEVEMIDGTVCDLNNEPRATRVLYVCYAHGKNEIYSLKETSTCNYEIVILTPNLCLHPKYKIQETKDNVINCLPIDKAPKKPKSLLQMEVESMKLRYQKLMDVNKGLKDAIAVFKVDSKDGKFHLELVDDKYNEIFERAKPNSKPAQLAFGFDEKPQDSSETESFLSGKTCLTGGTGWWKYEFCFNKYVRQFHIDKFGSKTSILLGLFDEKAHKDFLNAHPEKRPKPKGQRKQIVHYYTGGSACDKTGKQRETEVILKCVENASSRSQVSLYLLEPKVCHYVLGVESPVICDIINSVNEDGLIPKSEDVDNTVEEVNLERIRFQND